ncbi:similar to Saccharomyces cerevisiae YKR044W UIP5 Protein of unknown function that interacts with Ulp1p, a Ubl (ubiquitin-like protein)-specific protease for Smt3p protein conjugates [Maudiozyma barnettii]|uniref:L-type lectin-like domain-containing protein n=1 Tax=Maudiozyma barnettii TaxID=61262 RepID=A0A8H2VFJ4_9SACH|nr:Uip5p [Kazachstania barnettii]CAB4254596.1 similar to Saccharomyces cerevisiae YKR044W UIP5 Protein of unknown function that interacts with Ulp1p, a Ubl (ubiquitin-like protein)-specific protease for Smt3p protein conjugates [Kazachstania barnettii]CAD1782638.1 similar to Saccharomyces cerevisiae YKR044W UIP5 Protein of unknown function that interacts with Ulp1p, a Ubl (ubiquitin-like protein)-specific protease for Smt3p protein conjugates [Kazachstania barnettii]
MEYNDERRNKFGIAVIISLLFFIFHTHNNTNEYNGIHIPTLRQNLGKPNFARSYNSLIRVRNTDVTLSAPYLDKINKNWHVGGSTMIRNNGFIQLTRSGETNRAGSLLSNGVGDNKINNYETVYDFKLQDSHGDGMAFVMTSENGFIWRDLTSSYALRQYMTNTNGILPNDITMMGFPKNLPGLAIILQTNTVTGIPECDIYLNLDPSQHSYDFESFGRDSSSIKLNQYSIRLNENILNGQRTRLRIIYLESIRFLKIDISYTQGRNWEELYINQDLPWDLPKNRRSGERYIGVSSLAKHNSQSVSLFSIWTNEFHWSNNRDETMEIANDEFKKDALNFIQREYGVVVTTNTKNIQKQVPTKQQSPWFQSFGWIWLKIIAIIIILMIIYLMSIYLRVITKHVHKLKKKRLRRLRKKNNKDDMLLPI